MRDADKIEVFEDGYITIRTIFEEEADYVWDIYQHEDEWREVDALVAKFQKQFAPGAGELERREANEAGTRLLERFKPLFKKYLTLLRTGQINFKNSEQRSFVRLFINDPHLVKALNRKKAPQDFYDKITQNFMFLVEGYGRQDEDEILEDLHMIFLLLLKRYKNVGKSFCCYVYNLFKYEVARHIQKYQRNPCNFHYKVTTLDECQNISVEDEAFGDGLAEDIFGFPNRDWVNGIMCSDRFQKLSSEERLILSKYYLQYWNDAQIGELLGLHTNTVNQKRKGIIEQLCRDIGVDSSTLKRHRMSGKKAIRGTTV